MSDDRAAEHRRNLEMEQDQTYQMNLAIAKSRESVAPTEKPTNVDVPSVQPEGTAAVGDVLSCTMGNWTGNPTTYTYQWKSNTSNVGDGTAAYTVVAGDAGKNVSCVVTASNDLGTTTAPPSNKVAVPAAAKA